MKLKTKAISLVIGMVLPFMAGAQIITVGDPTSGVLDENYTLSTGSVDEAYVYDGSTFTQTGGSIGSWGLHLYDESSGSMSGGSAYSIQTSYNSTFTMNDGTVYSAQADGNGTFNMAGGSALRSYASQDATFNLSGGSVNYVNLWHNGMFNFSGGQVQSSLWLNDNANVTITGTDFGDYAPGTYDLRMLNFTPDDIYTNRSAGLFEIVFGDGSTTSFEVSANDPAGTSSDWSGTVTFIATPEPASVAGLAIAGLGGVVLARSRRRRVQRKQG